MIIKRVSYRSQDNERTVSIVRKNIIKIDIGIKQIHESTGKSLPVQYLWLGDERTNASFG
jgi:hypothetical protein